MSARPVKRAFKYRFHPTEAPALELWRTFGCVREPRFKSRKKSRASAEYTSSAFRFRNGALSLAKMSESLDIVWSRPLPEGAAPSTVPVSRDMAGRWFVSLLCEDPTVTPLPAANSAVGIDVGLDHLLVLSPCGQSATKQKIPRREP